MKMLSNAAWSFADAGLSPIIKDLNVELQKMTGDPEKIEEFKKNLAAIARLMEGICKVALIGGKIFAGIWNFDPSYGGTFWNPALNWFFGEKGN
jgi:hypothetical protein